MVVVFCLVPLAMTSQVHARDLTPAVRARLFRPTDNVKLDRRVVTIPMEGTDRHGYYRCPYFRVYVNGQGPFTFLFDTGAAYALVGRRVVEAARLPVVFDRNGHRDVVNIGAIRIAGVTLRNVWAIHDDDFDVDGIIGFPTFGMLNVLFDFSSRQLLTSRLPIALPGSFELPYQSPFNVPTVPLQIGDRTVAVLVDTGDDAYGLELRSAELSGVAFAHTPVTAEGVLNGSNLQPTRITTLVDPVALGPVHAESAVVAINDDVPVGDLGYELLRQFRIEVEPGRQVVVFQPVFQGDRFLLPAIRSAGFRIRFDGSGKVSNVIAGSAADAAGMATGDEILAIDGEPPQAYDPRSWDARIARDAALSVRWTHAGVLREARLAIEESR